MHTSHCSTPLQLKISGIIYLKIIYMKKKLFFATVLLYSLGSFAQPTSGLVAYWRMDGNFNDSTSNAINGTNSGATATTNNFGVANKAMDFNNPTSTVVQYATHPITTALNFSGTQNFTISFAFYINSPWVHNGGLYDNCLNYAGPGIYIWKPGLAPNLQFNYKNLSLASTSIPLATWKYGTFVRDNGTLKIYIDGVLNASGPEGTTAPTYSFAARFGTMFYNASAPPNYNPLHGKMDQMRIYNRALTQAEITQLYNLYLTPIPVKLSSFTAVNKNNTIGLNWQTQYEQNSSHFNIQRSTDGVNFTDLARVAAAANSNTVKNYVYNDILTVAMQPQKTIFYRLQSVDMDSKFSYSQILAIHTGNKEMQLFVSPNPAKDLLQVQTNAAAVKNAALIVVDVAGRQWYKKDLVLQQGINSIPVNISLLSAGTYSLRLVSENETLVKQFIKL